MTSPIGPNIITGFQPHRLDKVQVYLTFLDIEICIMHDTKISDLMKFQYS